MHTYAPLSLQSVNILHLTESKKWPGQDFKTQGHYDKVKAQIKIAAIMLKNFGM